MSKKNMKKGIKTGNKNKISENKTFKQKKQNR